ncbi:MAG: FCD domain-containing protein [Planctomycetaceae bacterium]
MLDVVERHNVSDRVQTRSNNTLSIMNSHQAIAYRRNTNSRNASVSAASAYVKRTRSLGFLGILNAKPGRGLTVGEVDMQRVTEFLGFHLAISNYPADQLIETRIIIETGALPYTMQNMLKDESIYNNLQEIIDELSTARSLKKWMKLDIAFHRLLLVSSGLQPLLAFNDLLEIFFEKFRESIKKAEWKSGNKSHQRMIDALKKQDLNAATEELRTHIASHRQSETRK